MKKSILSIIMTVCMLLGTVAGMTFTAGADAVAWDGSIDTSWYNTTDTEFTLTDAADLAGFAAITNGTADGFALDSFAGKKVKLGADITMNTGDASTWTETTEGLKTFAMISNADYNSYTQTSFFAGEFDGQGHTISGVYVNTAEIGYGGVGLFSGTYGSAKIHDFALVNSYFYQSGNRFAGGIVASAWMKSNAEEDAFEIYNIYTDAIITASGEKQGVGGIVGRISQVGGYEDGVSTNDYNEIYSCVFGGKVTQTGNCAAYTGGILGNLGDIGITITDCLNIGDVVSASNGKYIGGIIGKADPNHCKVNLIRCVSAVAPQSVTHQIGGLLTFGEKDPYAQTGRGWKIEDCFYIDAKYGVCRENAEYEDPQSNTTVTKLESYSELQGMNVASEITAKLKTDAAAGAKWTLRENGIIVPTGALAFNPVDYIIPGNDEGDGGNDDLGAAEDDESNEPVKKSEPETEAGTEASTTAETEAPEEKSGCGSVIGGSIIGAAAAGAIAVALCKKKKKD